MFLHIAWLVIFCLAIIPHAYSFLSTAAPINKNIINNDHQHLRSLPATLETLIQDTHDKDRKIVVVTGGVLSGIGKGVTASSIGVVSCVQIVHIICTFLLTHTIHIYNFITQLFRAMGYRVTALKIDPYLNVDAGTMSPFEHGEGM